MNYIFRGIIFSCKSRYSRNNGFKYISFSSIINQSLDLEEALRLLKKKKKNVLSK